MLSMTTARNKQWWILKGNPCEGNYILGYLDTIFYKQMRFKNMCTSVFVKV